MSCIGLLWLQLSAHERKHICRLGNANDANCGVFYYKDHHQSDLKLLLNCRAERQGEEQAETGPEAQGILSAAEPGLP